MNDYESKRQLNRAITGPRTRWAYVNLWRPASFNGKNPRYSIMMLIPKTDTRTIQNIKEAMIAAYKFGIRKLFKDGQDIPSFDDVKLPIKDGDIYQVGKEEYKGHLYMPAMSIHKPGIVDVDLNPITTHSEIYSGVYGRVSIHFYMYKNDNNDIGLACALDNVQKVCDGEPLGYRKSAEYDFSDYDNGI